MPRTVSSRRPTPTVPSVAMAAAVAMATCVLSACGSDGPATVSTGQVTPTPEPKPPEEICAQAVGYWAEQELRGDSGYGDYQSRGLSDSQNNILLEVVAEAKAHRKEHGEQAALEFAAREAAQRCDEYHRNSPPPSSASEGHGWPE